MTTYIPKVSEADRKWFVLDARDQVLGKLATTAAVILTGKRKPIYTPFLDTGDHVIVINAARVHLTGRKPEKKHFETGARGRPFLFTLAVSFPQCPCALAAPSTH